MPDLRMPDINQVLIAGRVSRDPELRHLPSGQAVCNLNVAVSRVTNKDGVKKEYTYWAQCVAWGKTAEYVNERIKKGSPVLVAGSLTQDEYEDKSGNKVTKTRIQVERVQALTWESKDEDERPSRPAPKPQPVAHPADDTEEIPF